MENELDDYILDDYGNSLLTLLWAKYGDSNHLIFATMEFYPKEIEEISEICIDSISLARDEKNNIADTEILFCRRKMTSEQALILYHEYMESGKFRLVHEDNDILYSRLL
ncbi:MAG: hypothetical protein ACTTH3_04265 [Schwartzia sp. (in: firmicutes)]